MIPVGTPSAVSPPTLQDEVALARGGALRFGRRPLVMGVLNITPDSFSDGGRWLEPERALQHAHEMIAAGADLLDLGAESSRPGGGVYGEGATPVSAEEETARLLPVLERLRPETDLPLSVDTRKGTVAEAALDAGADLVNDVSCLSDPQIARAAARAGAPLILMHSRGEIRSMQSRTSYEDLLGDVRRELEDALVRSQALGLPRERVLLDPGIGFAKTWSQNLTLLHRLGELADLGRPLVVGASRKSFIGRLSGARPDERLPGSLASAAWAAAQGAAMVRVHEVGETVQFLDVWSAIRDESPAEGRNA